MFRMSHRGSQWVELPLMLLGGWLIAAPFSLGYQDQALIWSDALSGAVILVLAFLGGAPRRYWVDLANTAVGFWLLLAPLVFWAPSPAAYLNDTLVGALVISFSIIIPMRMPMMGPDVPPGWTYNPSTWMQRFPIVALGFLSFLLAQHMAAFQLGHIDQAYDPFFGSGTERVLESEVSRAWPVSDAGLGAAIYLIELLSTMMGDARRWRTMPWMVAVFGFAVIPLGVVSIVLVILQPVSVGAWCTFCLLTALFMLLMIPLAVDEVVAMVQFMQASRKAGRPFWATFFLGGSLSDAKDADEVRPGHWLRRSMFWGIRARWNLVLSALLGIGIMAAPDLFGSTGHAANSFHIAGALVTVAAVIAMAEVTRGAVWANVVFGLWIAISGWLFEGSTTWSLVTGAITGGLVVALAFHRFPVRERYGGWDRFITPAVGEHPSTARNGRS